MLAFVNFGIYQRERLLTGGQDRASQAQPGRSALADAGRLYAAEFRGRRPGLSLGSRAKPWTTATSSSALDGRRVGHFRRFADGGPLAPGEIALRYRIRGGQPNFATNAYFFEEGRPAAFATAAYGEFRVGEDGEMILTRLRDSSFRVLRGEPSPT